MSTRLPVVEDIAALNALEVDDAVDVLLTLTNVKVTYVGEKEDLGDDWEYVTKDVVVLEDASAGIMLLGSGIGKHVAEGQVLNGKVALNVKASWLTTDYTMTDNFENVTVTDGEVTPMEITDDNLFEYLGNPYWRLVELKDVTFKVESGTYGDDVIMVSTVGEYVSLMSWAMA